MRRNLIVTLGVMLGLTGCGGGSGSSGGAAQTHRGVALIYEVIPGARAEINPHVLDRAAEVMRRRLAALGINQATVARVGDTFRVTSPAVKQSLAAGVVGRPGRLVFYDWEPNVIGPDGTPAPGDPTVTGGASAGAPGAGTHSHYAAVRLAAKRPPARSPGAAPGGQLYLLDPSARRVLAGPADTRARLLGSLRGRRLRRARVVRVNQGTILVRAEPPGGGAQTDRWYVLADRPALTGADITKPEATTDQVTKQPIVAFDFTDRGERRWREVTRTIARRGAASQNLRGGGNQHFAIVLDEDLLTVPFIDYRQNPDGIDASNGSQIVGGFTPRSAQRLAALLKSGALPVRVDLVSKRAVRLP